MSKNSPWWLALIQGLVALGAGLFLDPAKAACCSSAASSA